ncbi:MAG: hypothetical protein PUE51_06015 [Veillonellaceae bacterium]|nr:hypothetical protein [Veillonellaceae bacterium]
MNNLQRIAVMEAAASLEATARAAGIDIAEEIERIYRKIYAQS